MKTVELSRKCGLSRPTFYKYKAKFGRMTFWDAQQLKSLETEERTAEAASG